MDILLLTALAASGLIIAILSVGFYNLSIDKSLECAQIDRDLHQRGVAFNQSADDYQYRVNNLAGQYDLQGDLLAWRNHLANGYAQLQYDINNFEEKCG
jgi:hypothetical protein